MPNQNFSDAMRWAQKRSTEELRAFTSRYPKDVSKVAKARLEGRRIDSTLPFRNIKLRAAFHELILRSVS